MISSFVQLLREIQCSVQGIKLCSATETPANLDRQLEEIENKLCYVIIIMTRYQNGCTLPDSVKKGPPFNWDFDDAASTPSNSPVRMTNDDEDDDDDDALNPAAAGGGGEGGNGQPDSCEEESGNYDSIEEKKPDQTTDPPSKKEDNWNGTGFVDGHPDGEEDARRNSPPPLLGADPQNVKLEAMEENNTLAQTDASAVASTKDLVEGSSVSINSSSGKKRKRKKKKLKDVKRRGVGGSGGCGAGGGAAADDSESSTEEVTHATIEGVQYNTKLASTNQKQKGSKNPKSVESETEMAEPLKRFLNINFDELFKASGCTDGSEMSEDDRLDEEEDGQMGMVVSSRRGDVMLNAGGGPSPSNDSGQAVGTMDQGSAQPSPPLSNVQQAQQHTPLMSDMVIENEDSQSDTTLFSMNFPCEEEGNVSRENGPSPPTDFTLEDEAKPYPCSSQSPQLSRPDESSVNPPPTSSIGLHPPASTASPVGFYPERSLSPSDDLDISIPSFLLQSNQDEEKVAAIDDEDVGEKKLMIAEEGESSGGGVVPSDGTDDGVKNRRFAEMSSNPQHRDTFPALATSTSLPPPSQILRTDNSHLGKVSPDGSQSRQSSVDGSEENQSIEDEEEVVENYGRWHVVREESIGIPPSAIGTENTGGSKSGETSSTNTTGSTGGKKKKKKKSRSKIYPCPQCILTFSSKSSLKIHQKFDVHDKEDGLGNSEKNNSEYHSGTNPSSSSSEFSSASSGLPEKMLDPEDTLEGRKLTSAAPDISVNVGEKTPLNIAVDEALREDENGVGGGVEERESSIVDVEENNEDADCDEAVDDDDDIIEGLEDDEVNAKSDLTLMERLQMEAKNDSLARFGSSSSQEYSFDPTIAGNLSSQESNPFGPFVSPDEASAHLLRIAKPKKKTHKCGDCGKTFSTTGNLNVHYRAIHGGQKLMCGICDRGFAYIYSLKLHMESIHGGRRFPCAECDKDFAYASALKTHEAAVHRGRKFPCKFCKKEFTHSGDVTAHIESLHYGRRFPCKFCVDQKKVFTHRVNLRKHMKDEHGIHPKTTQNMKFYKTYEPTIDGKDFPEEIQKLHQKRGVVFAEEDAMMEEEEKMAGRMTEDDRDLEDIKDGSASFLPPLPPPTTSSHKLSFDEVLTSKKQMNQRYLCVVCRDEFKAVSALRSHMEMRHPDFVTRPTNGAKPCVSIIQSSKK